ncbi:MAG: hypothetical protein U5N86_13690 [Planctomycetota bacterium]|nr:hypothetical protein [Planctomycetota bacterium]
MKKAILFMAALFLTVAIATPAKAACEDVTIGADIAVVGYFADNFDWDDDSADSVAFMQEYVNIHLFNYYTDNVMSYIRLDAESTFDGFQQQYQPLASMSSSYAFTNDSQKVEIALDQAYIKLSEFSVRGSDSYCR